MIYVIVESRAGGWADRLSWQTGPWTVPKDMLFCPRKKLLGHCCPAPNHSRAGRERMLTRFFLGLVRSSAWGDSLQAETSGSQELNLPLSLSHPDKATLFPPASGSLYHGIKSQLVSASSRYISGLEGTQIIHSVECPVFSTRRKDGIMIT